jgi:cold shock CspA family protein
MMPTGRVKFWKRCVHDKPYGFITPDAPNEVDLYFDNRALVDKTYVPQRDDRVQFGRGPKGRYAKYVEPITEGMKP